MIALSDIERQQLLDNLLRWTKVEPLRPTEPHTTSLSTRKPCIYDVHMPAVLQPGRISLGTPVSGQPAENRYFQQLSTQDAAIKALRGKLSERLESSWARIISRLEFFVICNEEGVVDAQKEALQLVFRLVALAGFGLTDKQVALLDSWQLLVVAPSTEVDSKADIIIRLLPDEKIERLDRVLAQKCEPISPLLQNLERTYLDCITTMECKNLLLGHPNLYLTLLLLIRLMQCNSDVTFWPEVNCPGCLQFKNSHGALSNEFRWDLPQDSKEVYGLEAKFDLDHIDTEIFRVLQIIMSLPVEDQRLGPRPAEATVGITANETVKPTSRSPWPLAIHPYMVELWNIELRPLMSDLDPNQVPALSEIMRWVPLVRNIVIQCWSQMVHHNLSFGTITSFNTSFGVQRIRGPFGRAIISPLDMAAADGYIVRQASWVLDAWDNILKRRQQEKEQGISGWNDIFASGANPIVPVTDNDYKDPSLGPDGDDHNDETYLSPSEVDEDSEDDSEDDSIQGQQKGKKTSAKYAGPKSDASGPRRGGGPGGGADGRGPAGESASGGTGSSNQGAAFSNIPQKRSRGSTSGTGNTDKRARTHSDNVHIQPDELHLAFDCRNACLQSSGFSLFKDLYTDPQSNPQTAGSFPGQ